MKALIREPLLHFLLLGASLFAAFKLIGRADGPRPATIVVTHGRIESLATGFARSWQRPPTPVELEGLVRDHVREEVYVREAMALGLDKDDTIIRRRLRQKLEFISEDVAAQAEPTEQQLAAYLNAHADAFRTDRRFSFSQVHLDPRRRGQALAGDAARLLQRLRSGTQVDVATLGDSLLLETRLEDRPAGELEKQFGRGFTARLAEFPIGQWRGPIPSGYGAHLVFVHSRAEGRLPRLAEIRDAVRHEWSNARRLESNESFYQALLRRYTVVVEPAAPDKMRVADARR